MNTKRRNHAAGLAWRMLVPVLVAVVIIALAIAGLALKDSCRPGADRASHDRGLFRFVGLRQSVTPQEEAETPAEESEDAARMLAAETARAEEAEATAKGKAQLASLYEEFFRTAVQEASSNARDDQVTTAQAILDKAASQLNSSRVRKYRPEVLAEAEYFIGTRYVMADAYERGVEHLRKALELRVEHLGEDHEDTIDAMSQLAYAVSVKGGWDEAVELQRRVVDLVRAKGGNERGLLSPLNSLLEYLGYPGRLDEAEEVYREIIEITRKGKPSSSSARELISFGEFLQQRGKLDEAETVVREALEFLRVREGEDDSDTFEAMCRLTWLLQLRGESEEADLLHEKITDTARFMREIRSPFINSTYGEYLAWRGDFENAEYYLTKDLENIEKFFDGESRLNRRLERLVKLYEAWNKPDLAEQYRSRLVAPVPRDKAASDES